jgi:carboxypeptidase C (cathepsin A)
MFKRPAAWKFSASLLAAVSLTGWSAATQSPAPDRPMVSTNHQVTVDGRVLKYTATAGHIPIRENETGDVHGNMFFVSYALDRGTGAGRRPLTFLWNGGPGSSSSLVHLLGFGPRRVRTGTTAADNAGTWLDFTDLVFVDPIGTGYSRPTKAEYGPEFYQTQGDAESVAEFIRVYRNRFEAWDSPVFLAGESYGVTRAAGVASVLERRGITVAGVVLIGLALPLGQMSGEMRTALMLPTYTAAAHANHKLPPDLQRDLQGALEQSRTWASNEYAPALSKLATLTDDERQTIVAQIARFTGLDPSAIDKKTLAIGMEGFSQRLLNDERKVVGRYDSRLVGPIDPSQQQYDPTKDPSLKDIIDDVAVVRYLRTELKFESDLPYQGPFGGGYPPPANPRGDWMSVRWNRGPGTGQSQPGAAGTPAGQRGGGPPEQDRAPEQPLAVAMKASPRLEVIVACGYYDLVCSFAGNEHLASSLEPDQKRRVMARSYAGGHAIYTDTAAQLAMKRDVAEFFKRATAATPRP